MLVIGVALAAPVAAAHRDDGDDPGDPMSKLEALFFFGVIPLGLMLLIALLVTLPSLLKGKSNKAWDAQPEWYGGPELESGANPAVAGHDEAQALTGRVVVTGADGGEDDGGDGGGSSARW